MQISMPEEEGYMKTIRGLLPSEGDLCCCGIDCSSGACCCHMKDAPELACNPEEKGTINAEAHAAILDRLEQASSDDTLSSYAHNSQAPQMYDQHGHPDNLFEQYQGVDTALKPSEGLWTLLEAAASLDVPDNQESDVVPLSVKQCSKCKEHLPLSAFCANRKSADGHYSQCRSCIAMKDRERRVKMKQRQAIKTDSKECKRCHKIKSPSGFYSDPSRQDGLQSYCKDCFSESYKSRRRS